MYQICTGVPYLFITFSFFIHHISLFSSSYPLYPFHLNTLPGALGSNCMKMKPWVTHLMHANPLHSFHQGQRLDTTFITHLCKIQESRLDSNDSTPSPPVHVCDGPRPFKLYALHLLHKHHWIVHYDTWTNSFCKERHHSKIIK